MTTTSAPAAITQAEDILDGIIFIAHTDPACPQIVEDGGPVPSNVAPLEALWDCRVCIKGGTFHSFRTWMDREGGTEIERVEDNNKKPSTAPADAPTLTEQERYERVAAWLVSIDHKVEVVDITHMNKRVAQAWLRDYRGSFEFLTDLKAKGGVKSDGQAKGVLNCMRADLLRAAQNPAPVVANTAGATTETATTESGTTTGAPTGRPNRYPGKCQTCGQHVAEGDGVTVNQNGRWVVFHHDAPNGCPATPATAAAPATDLPDVPAGHYAIESSGHNDLVFYRIDRPTDGAYAGRVFVKMVVGGHPDQNVKAAAVPGILARIVEAGVVEAATLYGQEIGRCYRCNRSLTDETSRSLGIGPECRKH